MILINKNRSFFFKNTNYIFNKDLRKKFKCVLLSQTKIFIRKNRYRNKIKIGFKKILNRRLFLTYKRKIKFKRLNKKKVNKLNLKKRKIRSYKFFFFYLRRNKMKSSPRTLISKFKNFFIRRVCKKKKKFFFKF